MSPYKKQEPPKFKPVNEWLANENPLTRKNKGGLEIQVGIIRRMYKHLSKKFDSLESILAFYKLKLKDLEERINDINIKS
ncbi:MAG: hypothetical protein ACFFDH_09440 [Promethearchaeota archaeon]